MSEPLGYARTLITNRRYEAALALLRTRLTEDAEDPEAWCLTAQAHLSLREFGHAQFAARKALALDPESEWAHRLASLALSRVRKFTEARNEAEAAVALAPNVWQTHVQRVEVDLDAGFVDDDTWAAAHRALTLAPSEPTVHDVAGRVALAAHDARRAVASFHEALRLDPDDTTARNNLAVAQLRRRRFGTAGAHLVGALRLAPTTAVFQRNLRVLVLRLLALLEVATVLGCAAVIVTTVRRYEVRVGVFGPGRVTIPIASDRTSTLVLLRPTRLPYVTRLGPTGHPWMLVVVATLVAALALAAAVALRRGIGRDARRILTALVRSDRTLLTAALCCGVGVLLVAAAGVVGMPAARVLIFLAAPLEIVALVAGAVARRRLVRAASAAAF